MTTKYTLATTTILSFFSHVAYADEIMTCVGEGFVFPQTSIECIDGEGVKEVTTLNARNKDGWKILDVAVAANMGGVATIIYLEK